MAIPNARVFNELLKNLHIARTSDEIQAMITSLKAEFENLEDIDIAFVEERIKSPVSALKKYTEQEKYQTSWNSMKDLVGLMVVVDNNDEIDKLASYITKNHSQFKNPNSEFLIQDFRKKSVRKDKASKDNFAYQDPTGRPYQTTDGYKNVRANLMIDGLPIEIQLKTREQYIAHFATHDPTYKSGLLEEDEKTFISDKLFPYFEASAYLRLHRGIITPEEIASTRLDIKDIMSRNITHYQKYPKIFNDSRILFGVYTYMVLHRDEIIHDAVRETGVTSLQTTITELERVFKHTQKELIRQNPSLTHNTSIPATLDTLMDMPYSEFIQTKRQIAGDYRMDACSVTGVFDSVTLDFVKTVKKLGENYREVHVGVLSDSLSKAYLGRQPLYTSQQRMELVENCKGVTSVYEVSSAQSKPQVTLSYEIEGSEPTQKPYDYVIAGGVFDYHYGHKDHLRAIAEAGDNVIILVKTDKYSETVKHKTPVFDQDTRAAIVAAQKGVSAVYLTDNDIKPPDEVLEIIDSALADDKSVAIFMGSDWTKKRDEKPQSSLDELEFLQQNYPEVVLTSTPRPDNSFSSTGLRENLIEARESGDNNPYEITNLGESLV